MNIALIAAVAQDNAIGFENKIPWHIPGELQYFKKMTMGKPIIMGRKTFDSIGRPLPGRPNIVITRRPEWKQEQVFAAASLDRALHIAFGLAYKHQIHEIMIIGGAQIYHDALPQSHKIYLTRIHKKVNADTFFPIIDPNQWQETDRKDYTTTSPDAFQYAYTILERRKE